MNDQEKFSWLSQCPVCGRDLMNTTALAGMRLTCSVGHGTFKVINGMIIFDLNEQSEGEE